MRPVSWMRPLSRAVFIRSRVTRLWYRGWSRGIRVIAASEGGPMLKGLGRETFSPARRLTRRGTVARGDRGAGASVALAHDRGEPLGARAVRGRPGLPRWIVRRGRTGGGQRGGSVPVPGAGAVGGRDDGVPDAGGRFGACER